MGDLKERKKLEKKYTNLCLYNEIPLPRKGLRIMSVSPTSYYYETGINPKSGDVPIFRNLNKKSHYGLRLKIEKEVLEVLQNCFDGYFFKIKEKVLRLSLEELNSIFQRKNKKTIKNKNYNRLIKLLRRWEEESKNCHYKLNNAQKRLSKKFEKLIK